MPRTDSTKLIQFNVPQNVTSYVEDYGPKPPSKTEISDFSAENLRNNPHPKEVSFQFPRQTIIYQLVFAGIFIMATPVSFPSSN